MIRSFIFLVMILSPLGLLFNSWERIPKVVVQISHGEVASDEEMENRFHQIYLHYYQNPTPDEQWTQVLSKAQKQSYVVNAGDTLWGISQLFFGDPFYWPKIWALNSSQIFNPHEILPQQEIVFTPGTLESPPSIEVRNHQGESPAPEAVSEPPPTLQSEKGKIPPPLRPIVPVERPTAAFPKWTMKKNDSRPIGVDFKPLLRNYPMDPLALEYYASDSPAEALGFVHEVDSAMDSASENQWIYVKLDEEAMGKNFLVVKNMGIIPQNLFSKSIYEIQVLGEIQIRSLVNSDEKLYRAKITKSLSKIEIGSLLVDGKIKTYDDQAGNKAILNESLRIIGGAYNVERRFFSGNSIVFINGGIDKGIEPGYEYPIYKDQKLRNKHSDVVSGFLKIGSVKIIHTSDSVSTGVVLSSLEEIFLNDLVGANTQ